jgi:Na+-translocating ferredoxin:NAD+ oxidoreductase RNF subunit RnfB
MNVRTAPDNCVQPGIKRVIAINPDVDKDSKWHKTGKHAQQIFYEANVKADFYDPKEESQTSTL